MNNQTTKKIKIAIDVSPLYDANSTRGVGYYTQNLVKALQSEIKTNPEFQNLQIDLITNASDLKSKKYDLIHYPFFDPFKLTLPSPQKTPFIVTVHDLIPRQFRKHFPVGIRGEIKWLIQKHRLKLAKYLITVSHYSKYVIKNIVNFPERRIFVTHLGIGENFKKINDQTKLKEVSQKYNLPKKFILFVGDLNWNKNVPNLVRSCLLLGYPLVIVGSAATRQNVENHPWNKDIIWLQNKSKELQEQNKKNSLILTGFVPDSELPIIFNLATIYCQPSFAEGFGIPVVQAMKSGCPVAYSNTTSLSEVMDNNGESFDPHSISSIKKSLKNLWSNEKLRSNYIKKALIYAQSFDWRYTAIQTLDIYRLAVLDEKK